jgi:hypothetical protein
MSRWTQIGAIVAGRALPAAPDLGTDARGIPREMLAARWRESAPGAEIRRYGPALRAQGAGP